MKRRKSTSGNTPYKWSSGVSNMRLWARGVKSPFQVAWKSENDISVKWTTVVTKMEGPLRLQLVWLHSYRKFGDVEGTQLANIRGEVSKEVKRVVVRHRRDLSTELNAQSRGKGRRLSTKLELLKIYGSQGTQEIGFFNMFQELVGEKA